MLNLIPLRKSRRYPLYRRIQTCSPLQIRRNVQVRWNQFLPFMITITAILFTDHREESYRPSRFHFLHPQEQLRQSFWMTTMEEAGKTVHRMTLAESVFFLNKGGHSGRTAEDSA